MNELNKKKSKAWPLAAAALALGLCGVVGASAFYADRADDAANIQPAQSVKMRVVDDEEDGHLFIMEYGSYTDMYGVLVSLSATSSVTLDESLFYYGDSLDGTLSSANSYGCSNLYPSADYSGWVFEGGADFVSSEYSKLIVTIGSNDLHVIWQSGAGNSWSVAQSADLEDEYYNLNFVSKPLISQIFDDVGGGVTGVAGTITTGVTSVVGLFWDVENVRFTTLGTLTLVGLAAGLVYFGIRMVYRAVKGVA